MNKVLSLIFFFLFLISCSSKKLDKNNHVNKQIEFKCPQVQGYPTFCFDTTVKSNELLVVEEIFNDKVIKQKTEKLKLEKMGKWQTHMFCDTVKSNFFYRIFILRNSDTIQKSKLSNIKFGRIGVYKRKICTLISYQINGVIKTKELANIYQIIK